MAVPTIEPQKFVAGDTLKFKIYLSDYLPSDSWVLSYAFANTGNVYEITGTDNGDGYHLITETAANTKIWVPGEYKYQAYVTKGAERYKVREGSLEIVANYAEQSNYDSRSHVKKVLDALEAMIEGRASKDHASYSINGRTLARLSPEELRIEWEKYKRYYNDEVKAERIKKGLSHSGRIAVRF